MIKSFIHKGLERFFRTGDTSGINKMYASKIARVLSVLEIKEGHVYIVNYEDYH